MTLEPGLDADLVARLRAPGRLDERAVKEAAERIEFLFEAFAKCTRSLRAYHERIEVLEAALEEIVKNPHYGGAHVIAWKALAGKS